MAIDKIQDKRILDEYEVRVNKLIANIKVVDYEDNFVPLYIVSILNISKVTLAVLDKIKEEFVSKINIGAIQLSMEGGYKSLEKEFVSELGVLIKKYLPHVDKPTADFLVNHLIQESLGFGKIDILLNDSNLEEIVVNNSKEPVWAYHREFGWVKTNIYIDSENKIRHYATIIGRDIGKDINVLNPLMDASLKTGDRVNATLSPISTKGNTITIRKFADRPWTVTDMIKNGTVNFEVVSWIWLAIEYELSFIISGGTGSGKTSMLNALSNFFPANQRIITIEDTRELVLPTHLHWVPMETRMANPEGKGEISMLDLVVNSLRMRPDRILVGEIRRKREAEVLFEAMHTGHSVYGTLHANNAQETISRLINPPIEVPKSVLSSLSLIVVQYRNRRTGKRVTLQVAEVTNDGNERVIFQYNMNSNRFEMINKPDRMLRTINLYSGLTDADILSDLKSKQEFLKWIVDRNINDVNKVGLLISQYYKKLEKEAKQKKKK